MHYYIYMGSIIVVGVLLVISIGVMLAGFSEEELGTVFFGLGLTFVLGWGEIALVEDFGKIHKNGIVRQQCIDRSLRDIVVMHNNIPYKDREEYCKEYAPKEIYIDKQWHTVVEPNGKSK